jgi:hypothetical protein
MQMSASINQSINQSLIGFFPTWLLLGDFSPTASTSTFVSLSPSTCLGRVGTSREWDELVSNSNSNSNSNSKADEKLSLWLVGWLAGLAGWLAGGWAGLEPNVDFTTNHLG